MMTKAPCLPRSEQLRFGRNSSLTHLLFKVNADQLSRSARGLGRRVFHTLICSWRTLVAPLTAKRRETNNG